MSKRREKDGTNHARNALQRRYKLNLPFKVFLDLIAAGKATELKCTVPGRKIFDVYLEGPSVTVRTVIGGADVEAENRFIVTFLPTHWPGDQSRLKRLNGRDKRKYHAVFRNVRLRLEKAAGEFRKEEFDEDLFSLETELRESTVANEIFSADQTKEHFTSNDPPRPLVNPAPKKFSTLALQLSTLGRLRLL
ncbi:MAG: hypothetical protein WBV36_21695 [Terriglobales bacterium]